VLFAINSFRAAANQDAIGDSTSPHGASGGGSTLRPINPYKPQAWSPSPAAAIDLTVSPNRRCNVRALTYFGRGAKGRKK